MNGFDRLMLDIVIGLDNDRDKMPFCKRYTDETDLLEIYNSFKSDDCKKRKINSIIRSYNGNDDNEQQIPDFDFIRNIGNGQEAYRIKKNICNFVSSMRQDVKYMVEWYERYNNVGDETEKSQILSSIITAKIDQFLKKLQIQFD